MFGDFSNHSLFVTKNQFTLNHSQIFPNFSNFHLMDPQFSNLKEPDTKFFSALHNPLGEQSMAVPEQQKILKKLNDKNKPGIRKSLIMIGNGDEEPRFVNEKQFFF